MILDRIFGRSALSGPGSEAAWSASHSVFSNILGSFRSASGESVTPESALRSTPVLACVRVLSETLASFPLKVYRRLPDGSKEVARDHPLYSVLHNRPNQWQTSFEWRQMSQAHLSLRGNAYSIIVPGPRGAVDQLLPVRPDRMRIERLTSGRLLYSVLWPDGKTSKYSQEEILHLRGFSLDGIVGLSPIELMRNGIGLSLATETYGSALFKNGGRPGMVFETDEKKLDPKVADDVLTQWKKNYAGAENGWKTAILPFGLKAHELGLSNDDAQFLETRKFQVSEIARAYRVPPHMIGDLERATFSNIEQQNLEFLQYTMRPWLSNWEASIQRDLVVDEDVFAEFLVDDLMRADSAARSQFYREMFNIGVFSINEIRALENQNGIGPVGDERWIQMNMTTIDKARLAEPAPKPAPSLAPSPEQTPLLTAADHTSERTASAVDPARSLLLSTATRMIHLEVEGVKRAANKSNFLDAMESFYGDHESRFKEAIDGPAKILAIVSGEKFDAELIVREHIQHSRELLLEVAGKANPSGLADDVAFCVMDWSKRAWRLAGISTEEDHE